MISGETAGTARCAVMLAPGRVEVVERPLPDVSADAALLRVEVCGVCGSDVELFDGDFRGARFPVAPGHEPVGRIERIGSDASRRWGLLAGDRVAMLSSLRCDRCRGCAEGGPCVVVGPGLPNYGFLSPDVAPGLWGGFATHLYVAPTARFVRMNGDVPLGPASLFNALANGYEWTLSVGGVRPGHKVVIFGPGPRGLACVVAAREAGAGFIAVVGLPADGERLILAEELGADVTVVVGDAPIEDVTLEVLGSDADVVIDTSPRATDVPAAAVLLARAGGTIVLAGFKGDGRTAALPVDLVVDRHLVLRGAPSKSLESTRLAVRCLERSAGRFASLASHVFALDRLGEALAAARGNVAPGELRPLHVRVEP